MVPLTDLLEAQVRVATTKKDLIMAENRLALARSKLGIEMGVGIEKEIEVEESLPAVAIEGDLSDDIRRAWEKRLELELKRVERNIADEERKVAASENFPVLFLNSSVSYESNELNPYRRAYAAVVGARWNLFSGFRDQARKKQAVLRKRQIESEAERIRDAIALEAKAAYLDYVEAREKINVAEMSVRKAEENLRIINLKYREGEGSSTDVIDAQFLLTTALEDLENARYDMLLAGFRRLRARGELLEFILGE
jgi:outer membrane protein TolC